MLLQGARESLAVEEGLVQQRQQLLAVHVVRIQLQGLARVLVGLLEVALEHKVTHHAMHRSAAALTMR